MSRTGNYRIEGIRIWSDYVGTISRRVIEAANSAKMLAASNGRYMTQFENNLRGIGVSNIEGQTRDDFISWFVEAHDYVVSSANSVEQQIPTFSKFWKTMAWYLLKSSLFWQFYYKRSKKER